MREIILLLDKLNDMAENMIYIAPEITTIEFLKQEIANPNTTEEERAKDQKLLNELLKTEK